MESDQPSLKLIPRSPSYYIDGGQSYPTIIIEGESILPAAAHILASDSQQKNMNMFDSPTAATIIKWFPGIQMHRALAIAAKRGMEDFIAILIAVGNDADALNGVPSLNGLFSKIRIS